MATRDNHNNSSAGTQIQQNVSTMQCFGNSIADDDTTTMVSNTSDDIASESSSIIHGSDVRNSNSIGSYHFVSSISNCNEGSRCSGDSYTDDDDDEGDSLVPEWQDDGDDSFCTNICDDNVDVDMDVDMDIDIENDDHGIHRIPSTLEFNVTDGEGEQQQQQQQQESPLVSPSSLSYSQHSSHRLLQIEMVEDGSFPSIPIISVPYGRMDINSKRNDRNAGPNNGTIVSTAKRRNGFRRGLHIHTDIGGSAGPNNNTSNNNHHRLPESQSFSSSSASPSPLARSRSINSFCRSRPRFSLVFGAILLVMLSVHDSVNSSRQYYRQQYQLLSSDRREEIEFPLVQLETTRTATITTTADGVTRNNSVRTNHHEQQRKAELPKFYFRKTDPSNANTIANTNGMIRGSPSSSSSSSFNSAIRPNLAMGRPRQPRPIFVPDTPLPDGGFRKPLERFVFDSQQGQQREQQQQYQRNQRLVLENDSSSSWTSWMVSLTLIGMLCDTGWKEYRRYRISAISSSRDE